METLTAYLRAALAWIASHPAECWAIASGVLNTLLRVKSAERWVELAEKTRVGGAIISLVRSWGFDPVGGLRVAALAVSAKAAGHGVGAFFAAPPSEPPSPSPPTPRNAGVGP